MCHKCNGSGVHFNLPCIHCQDVAKHAIEIRREIYGASKWALAAATFHASSARPLAKLVLQQAPNLLSLNPAKRAVLAQDARRCLN